MKVLAVLEQGRLDPDRAAGLIKTLGDSYGGRYEGMGEEKIENKKNNGE
ncbi:hypothetical protein GF338_10835 [candidate division WOR-3 bacterium]|nr:hypothetical protein [candidate division WOR-3 bacterium]